jgi:hypothetical protein
MSKISIRLTAALASAFAVWPALAVENETIPNFAPDSTTGWLKPPGDEFIQPETGPGPVKADPAHPYFSNAIANQETVKIADLTNSILQPWVVEQMRKENDAVLVRKVGFTARSRCWPHAAGPGVCASGRKGSIGGRSRTVSAVSI